MTRPATGEELAAKVRTAARAAGKTVSEFLMPITPYGASWLRSVETHLTPKPLTVSRIEALLSGRAIPHRAPGDVVIGHPLRRSAEYVGSNDDIAARRDADQARLADERAVLMARADAVEAEARARRIARDRRTMMARRKLGLAA